MPPSRSADREDIELRRDLERLEMIVDREDPDYLAHRFFRCVYRTSRALLICRQLLLPGQSLTRAVAESDDRLFWVQAPISPSSILSHLVPVMGGPIATLPHPDSDQHELEVLASAHFSTAVRLGYSPNDPILRWFAPGCLLEAMPEGPALLALDSQIVTLGGSLLVLEGKSRAMQWMVDILGQVSAAERADWMGIPVDYVRDFMAMSTDDERALMVARLESVAYQAKESMDTRTELMALRLVASVQGLTFADEGRSQRELLTLLAAGKTERSLEAARSTYVAALPEPQRAIE